MKKFLFLLCLSVFPFSAFGQEITLTSLQEKFSTAYIQEYNLANLENDIATPILSDGVYDNSIQSLSKEKSWDKKKFTDFVKALKNKNTQKAKDLYSKDWEVMSPFLPTCCSDNTYISFKILKGGILVLVKTTTGTPFYDLQYIFYANNRLFSIHSKAYFFEDLDESCTNSSDKSCTYSLLYDNEGNGYRTSNSKVIKTRHYVNGKTSFIGLMLHWFDNPDKANSYFKKEYNAFIESMKLVGK